MSSKVREVSKPQIKVVGNLRIIEWLPDGTKWSEETRCQTIVDTGLNWIVDLLHGGAAATDALKWHQSGTGVAAATGTDTSLGTALYSRIAGSQGEGTTANVYRTAATVNYTGSHSVTEWGVFTTSTGGSLGARDTFTAKSVTNGSALTFTWDLTASRA